MDTVLNTLHVVLAVLVIGPLVLTPFAARRAITKRSADGVRLAANGAALFGAGAVVVAGLGVATVLTGDEWDMVTPWVLIASTLFVVALGLTWGYAVPALRRAASMVSAGVPDGRPAAVADDVGAAGSGAAAAAGTGTTAGTEAAAETGTGTGTGTDLTEQELAEADTVPTPLAPAGSFVTTEDMAAIQRLDSLSARITGAGWLLLVTFVAITVLMTARPFS